MKSRLIAATFTAFFLVVGAGCGAASEPSGAHAHGEETHTHEAEESAAAPAAGTSETYLDTTGAAFDTTATGIAPVHGDHAHEEDGRHPGDHPDDEAAHSHGADTHTHEQ